MPPDDDYDMPPIYSRFERDTVYAEVNATVENLVSFYQQGGADCESYDDGMGCWNTNRPGMQYNMFIKTSDLSHQRVEYWFEIRWKSCGTFEDSIF